MRKKDKKINISKGYYNYYIAPLPCIVINTGVFERFVCLQFWRWYIKFSRIPDIKKFTKTYQVKLGAEEAEK